MVNSFRLLICFLENDHLLILILIVLGICLTMDAACLEATLMYVGITLE